MAKIVLVGAGNMGYAMLQRWIAETGHSFTVVEPDEALRDRASATPLDRLRTWIDQPVVLSQAIPFPSSPISRARPLSIPPTRVSHAIFSALGTAVTVESRREYYLLAAASAMMGTYFGVLEAVSSWLESEGLPKRAGDAYLRPLFAGLDLAARSKSGAGFAEPAEMHSTKGGLNEQLLGDFKGLGGERALQQALGRVLARIRGGS